MAKNGKYTRREVMNTMAAAAATPAMMSLPVEAATNEPQQIRRWRVQRYAFGWNAKQRVGRVALWLENYNQNPFWFNVSLPQEFEGYVTILKQNDVYITSSGWLHTGTDTVDWK